VSSIFVSIPVSKFMMRHLYLVSALLLCHPVSSERDADCSAKLTPEAEMKCKRAKRKASSFTDHVSLATQNQVSLTTQINTDILLRVTEMEDKDKVAEFQGVALRTVLDAIRFFTAKNHTAQNITTGVSSLALGLWKCIMFFIPQKTQNTATFQWFDKAWVSTFDTMRRVQAQEIEGHIQDFNENGQGYHVAHVIYMCVDSSLDLVDKFVNQTVASKISPWFEGVRSITKAVADSWEAIANGDPTKAAQVIYKGVRDAADAVLPASVKNHEAYVYITGILDEQIGNLNTYVMGFKKELAQSTICIRGNIERNHSRELTCFKGKDWIVHNGCCLDNPNKANLLQTGGSGSFIQEWEAGAREELLQVRSKAACEPIREPVCRNPNQCPLHGDPPACIADCAKGFREPKGTSKGFCWQDCPEDFPHHVDGKKKCARSDAAWDELNMEKIAKVAGVVTAGVDFVMGLINKKEDSDNEKIIKSLNMVVKSGVEFAQTFFFADCAMPEVPTIEC